MDITPRIPAGKQLIQSYGDGAFTVSGVSYSSDIMVFPSCCMPWQEVLSMPRQDGIVDIAALTDVHFQSFIDQLKISPVRVLLLGTGKKLQPISHIVRQKLKDFGVTIDVMDTGAACRTYNVLLSEERDVAALLFAV